MATTQRRWAGWEVGGKSSKGKQGSEYVFPTHLPGRNHRAAAVPPTSRELADILR